MTKIPLLHKKKLIEKCSYREMLIGVDSFKSDTYGPFAVPL